VTESSTKPGLITSSVHNTSITHHLHTALPVNHHAVTSFQAPAARDVTTLSQFYSKRLNCEAAGQTNAFLHVSSVFPFANITLCTVIATITS